MAESGPADGSPVKFEKNTKIVLSFLWAWVAFTVVHALFYSSIQQKELLRESRRLAWRNGILPAIRGKILDRNGEILAETRAVYHLTISHETSSALKKKITSEVRKVFPAVREPDEKGILIAEMSPAEITKAASLIRRRAELKIVPEFQRHIRNAALKEKIGALDKNGRGISGFEKEYDAELNGKKGRFTVMLDRKGGWISGSIHVLESPVHGKDIRVKEVSK